MNGEQVPTPFFSDGRPNTVFESAYGGLVSYLAQYSPGRGVKLLHLPWYGQVRAELNNGIEVRSEPGYSESALINAHERLLDIAIPFSGDDLAVEFPMSGYGPLQRVSRELTAHIVSWSERRARGCTCNPTGSVPTETGERRPERRGADGSGGVLPSVLRGEQ